MDVQQEFNALCDNMSKEIIKPFLVQKEHIYIDADLLYDYRLGALIAQTRSEEEYNYVLLHLKEYINAPSLDCARFFPDLGLTDDDLDAFISDEKNYHVINAISPASNFIDNIDKVIRIFNTINESKEVSRPITITINQRMCKIHNVYKTGLINRIHSTDPSIIVEFTEYRSWNEVPESLIEAQDFLCVYVMVEFLKEGTRSQKLMASVPPKMGRCSIVTLLQSDQQMPTNESFTNLKIMLEVMCDKFTFINKTLVNEELING